MSEKSKRSNYTGIYGNYCSILKNHIEDLNTYEPPLLPEFNHGKLLLSTLGRDISDALHSSSKTPINEELAQLIELSVRYLFQETLQSQKDSILSSAAMNRMTSTNTHQNNSTESYAEKTGENAIKETNVRDLKEEIDLLNEKLAKEKESAKKYVKSINQMKLNEKKKEEEANMMIGDLKIQISTYERGNASFKRQIDFLQKKFDNVIDELKATGDVLDKKDEEIERLEQENNFINIEKAKIELELDHLNKNADLITSDFTKSCSEVPTQLNYQDFENEKINSLHIKLLELSRLEHETVKNINEELAKCKESESNFRKKIEDLNAEISKMKKEISIHKKNDNSASCSDESFYKTRCVMNGMIAFINSLLNDDNEISSVLFTKEKLKNNEKIVEEVKSAIDRSLNIDSNAIFLPLMDASVGSVDASNGIMKFLLRKKDENIFSVVSLLSIINGKMYKLLTDNKNLRKTLLRYLPNSTEKTLDEDILSIIRNIKQLENRAKNTLASPFGLKDVASNVLPVYMDNVQQLIERIETQLRPIVNCDFIDIPIFIRKHIDVLHNKVERRKEKIKETEQGKNIRMNEAKNKISQLESEVKELKKKLQSKDNELKNMKKEYNVLEKVSKETYEMTNALRERAELAEQKNKTVESESKQIKEFSEKREDEFRSRSELMLKREQERHEEEIKRVEKIYVKQINVLEEREKKLSERLEIRKKMVDEILNSSINKSQTLHISSNDDLSNLSLILNECFVIKDQWTLPKIEKAVRALVTRVKLLEKQIKST